jgi:hypothetical protein
MEAACSFEKSLNIYRTTRRYVPLDSTQHTEVDLMLVQCEVQYILYVTTNNEHVYQIIRVFFSRKHYSTLSMPVENPVSNSCDTLFKTDGVGASTVHCCS